MKERGICIYKPEVLFWGKGAGFHGYSLTFINNHANCIYVNGFVRGFKYRRQLWKMGIKRYIPIVHSLKKVNQTCDILVGFVVPADEDHEIDEFQGKKFFHLMDYYLYVTRNKNFLKRFKIDYVIGHTQMDKNCEFFNEYYPDYKGKVISLPFGYAERFVNIRVFEKRKNIAVGLGSINPVDDPLVPNYAKKEFVEYFQQYQFMHPLRRYLQLRKDEFSDVVEARFPDPKKQKDFTYNAVEVLNEYKMFINDAGLSNFPPARTYEGIASGCVMVAEDSTIYRELGFQADINYIAFPKGDYRKMRDKIKYYIDHQDELKNIQEKSLELAVHFSHEAISEMLYKAVIAMTE